MGKPRVQASRHLTRSSRWKVRLSIDATARHQGWLFISALAALVAFVLMWGNNPPVVAAQSATNETQTRDVTTSVLARAPKGLQTYSTDAVVVFEKPTGIYYSIYGHNPPIPTPVTQTVTWNWWSIGGGGASDTGTPTRPLTETAEKLARPDVAFSREGFALAVWGGVQGLGTVFSCTDGIGNPNFFPRFRGGVRSSRLAEQANGDFLLSAAPNIDPPANTTTQDQYYHNPSIAIDSNGTAIVVYIYTKITYSDPCGISAEMSVLSRRWDGANWVDEKIIAGPELTWCSPPNGTPYLSYHCEHYTDVSFTSRLATDGSPNTRQQAMAVWYDLIDVPTVLCPALTPVPVFWPKSSVWNGASWTASGEIPGRPAAPPYMKYTDGKLGISGDQFENARLVFPVNNDPDPCTGGDETLQVRDSNWTGKATQTWSSAAVLQTGLSPDVAVMQDNTAIDVHAAADLSSIKWATANVSGTWTTQGDLSLDASSKNPTIAAVHAAGGSAARAVSVWNAGDGLRWSSRIVTGTWSASAILDADGGDYPELAAHTGSPGLPHAEWTLGMYEARDENGGSTKTTFIQNQWQAYGSTALVNAVGVSEDNLNAAAYRYYKQGANTTRRNIGAMDLGNPNNVRDFVAWFVETYPSKRTLVEFENHGTPWKGCCYDRTPQGNLTLTEINSGLTASGQNLNILLFRCCMMGTVETAYTVRQRANYMLASQDWVDTPLATNGNGGFRNDCLLKPSNPYTVPVATPCGAGSNGLGLIDDPFRTDRVIVSDTVTIYKNTNDNQTTRDHTLSAIDLGQIGTPGSPGTLMNRISTLANSLNTNFTGNEAAIRAAVDNAERFVESWSTVSVTKTNQPRAAGMRDLRGFAQNLNTDGTLPLAVRNAAADVSTAVSNTVVAYWGDDMHRVGDADAGALQVNGLNIWIERTKAVYNTQAPIYNPLAFETDLVAVGANNSWSAFVNRVAQSTGALMQLDSPNPDVFIRAGLGTGEQVGGVDAAHDCGGYCASTVGDATCIDDSIDELVWMPNTHPSFTWYVDGTSIASTASFTFTIQTVVSGVTTNTITQTGSLSPGQIISGTYPNIRLSLPLILR